ncbi:unnamed protein product [Porites evermanni]|uniref:Uncharacterized protein n=1 Tax=Porites evermanni TaxID=104178 RepID=A0ABN8STX0_9CNID|nr:unnamed protein product [Porites evermanni]
MRISNLPEEFSGPQRNDTLGVPLLDCDCIWTIWESEQDIAYLQDPEVVQLYTKTSKIVKGGRELPLYCCSRGSTCHNHLDFFIPGTSANDLHFHAFLLEGVARWNRDREVAGVTEANSDTIYCSRLLP